MINNLVIVESPNKAKTLNKYFPKELDGEKQHWDFISTYGHLGDINHGGVNGWGFKDKDKFEPLYTIKNKSQFDAIKDTIIVGDYDKIFLAADPDREGEAIAYQLALYLSAKGSSEDNISNVSDFVYGEWKERDIDDLRDFLMVKTNTTIKPEDPVIFIQDNLTNDLYIEWIQKDFIRITFNSISKSAVAKSLKNQRKIDMNYVRSQEARRLIDRIYGFTASPIVKNFINAKSIGRVQGGGLKLFYDKEMSIVNFVPKSYHSISFNDLVGNKFILTSKDKFNIPQDLINNIKEDYKKELKINDVNVYEVNINPPKPHHTNDVYSLAAKYGIKISDCKNILQELFQEGYITYHRTDSRSLSEDFVKKAKNYIINNIGYEVNDDIGVKVKKSKGAQEAHEAIRPVDITLDSVMLSKKHQKVYNMIRKITIASLMKAGVDEKRKYGVIVNGETFETIETFTKYEGFRPYLKKKLSALSKPSYEKGDLVKKEGDLSITEDKTLPPARYNESSFVKALEKNGIGRPATYASALEVIQKRVYVENIESKKKQADIKITDLGMKLIKWVEDNLKDLNRLDFTSDLEKDLDLIAKGNKTFINVVRDFDNYLDEQVKKFFGVCLQCGATKVVGKGKKFCPNWENDRKTGRRCPTCKTHQLYKNINIGSKSVYCSNKDCNFKAYIK